MLSNFGEIQIMEYPKFINHLFSWANFEIVGYRILRLFLTLCSSLIFAKGFISLLKKLDISSNKFYLGNKFTYLFILVGSLLSYALFPQTISYNSLTLINIQFALGLIFYSMSKNQSYQKNLLLLSAGLFIGFQNFVKFSNGVIFFFLFSFLIFFFDYYQTSIIEKIKKLLWFGIGVIILVLYYSLFLGSLEDWLHKVLNTIEANDSHGIDKLFELYWKTFKKGIEFVILSFKYPIAVTLIITLCQKFILNKINWTPPSFIKSLIALSFFCYSIYFAISNLWYINDSKHIYDMPLIYILWLIIGILGFLLSLLSKTFFSQRKKLFPSNFLLLVVVLFSTPFLCSFGTNNNVLLHIVQYQFSWFGLFILFSIILGKFLKNRVFPTIYIVTLCGFCIAQTYTGLIINPYRIEGELTSQKEQLELPTNNKLLVDKALKNHIESINKIIKKAPIKKNKQLLLPLYCSPGMVYLLNCKSPGSGWYRTKLTHENCENLKSSTDDLGDLIILVDREEGIPDEMVDCLNSLNINYPNDYNFAGSVEGYPQKTLIDIYFPKRNKQ